MLRGAGVGVYKIQGCFLLAAMAFLLLAWLLPNHYEPWGSAYQEFSVFFAMIFIFASLFGQVRFKIGMAVFFILPCVPLLQQLVGVIFFAGDAWMAVFYIVGAGLMLLAGYNLSIRPVGRASLVVALAVVLVVGAVLSVWIALRQWLLLSGSIWVADFPFGGRPFANLAQPNNLATLLCMGLAGVLYFYEKKYLGRIAAGLLAFFLIFGVALTQSRTPWVGAIFALVWWFWKSRSVAVRLPVGGFSFWIGIYTLAVLGVPFLAEVLGLTAASLAERAQATQRLDMWWQLWQAVVSGPLWGYGWNQISVAQVGVALSHPVPIMTEHGHNILLDVLLWNGPVLGGLIILLMAVWLARLCWHACTIESVLALMMVGFVLVHGMLEYPLEYAFFLFPVGLLLGVVEADQKTSVVVTMPRWVYAVIVMVVTGLQGWVWYEYRVLEEDHRLMRFENAQIGELMAEKSAPDVVVLTQLRELIRFSRTEPRDGMSMGELDWMRKVAHRYPYPANLFRYALALGLNRQSRAAYVQILILRSLHGEKRYEAAVLGLQLMLESHPQLELLLVQLPRAKV